jgi:hypothetical protein
MKCYVILVITVAMGIVIKELNKYPETITGNHPTDFLSLKPEWQDP